MTAPGNATGDSSGRPGEAVVSHVIHRTLRLRLAAGFGVLLALILALASSLVSDALRDIRHARAMAESADQAVLLETAAAELSFERERMAGLLGAPQAASDEELAAVHEHRRAAAEALKQGLAALRDGALAGEADRLEGPHAEMEALRAEADRSARMLQGERDPELASAWTTTATRFLDGVAALARAVRSGLAPADPHASTADKAASAKMRMFVYGGMGAAAVLIACALLALVLMGTIRPIMRIAEAARDDRSPPDLEEREDEIGDAARAIAGLAAKARLVERERKSREPSTSPPPRPRLVE